MRLDGAGVPLEVALTAKLGHPNLLAVRAHAIIRYAARASSSGCDTPPSQHSASLDSRPPLAPDTAPSSARTAPCTPAAPRWTSQGAGSGFRSGSEDAAGARCSSAGASAGSSPADGAQLGHAARQDAAPSCTSYGGGGSGACSRESSLCGERGSAGRDRGATPPRSARDWDSPGAWGSLPGLGSAGPGRAPADAARPGSAAGAAGAAGRGDGGGPAAQLLASCGAGPGGGGGGGGPAQREEGEVWLLLDFCDRGCLAARARPARALSGVPLLPGDAARPLLLDLWLLVGRTGHGKWLGLGFMVSWHALLPGLCSLACGSDGTATGCRAAAGCTGPPWSCSHGVSMQSEGALRSACGAGLPLACGATRQSIHNSCGVRQAGAGIEPCRLGLQTPERTLADIWGPVCVIIGSEGDPVAQDAARKGWLRTSTLGPADARVVASVMADIAGGMAALHAASVVHGDLSGGARPRRTRRRRAWADGRSACSGAPPGLPGPALEAAPCEQASLPGRRPLV